MAVNSTSSHSAGCHLTKSNIIAAALLAFSIVSAAAQQPPAVSLKIDLVAWGNEIRGLALQPGARGATLTAPGFRYSKPVKYSGPAVMALYQNQAAESQPAVKPSADDLAHELHPLIVEDKDAGAGGAAVGALAQQLEQRRKLEPTLVALVRLPANSRRATVLLERARGGTFVAYVIDDDPARLPVGQVRIHNLCPLPILMRCNGKQGQPLDTRQSLLVPASNNHLVYELSYKTATGWQMQENNVIPVPPQEQTQLIILKSRHAYFKSADGSTGGFLQLVTLHRNPAS